MTEQTDEREEETKAPGAVAKALVRGVDACIGWLQKLRNRFAPGDEFIAPPPSDDAEAPATAKGMSKLAWLLVSLVCLLLGAGGGGFLAYRALSIKLKAHDQIVGQLQEQIDIDKKEEAHAVNQMARFQRENGEFREQARIAVRQADDYRKQVADLEEQVEKLRADRPGASVSLKPAPARKPEKSGRCAVGTADAGSQLTDCIDKFNRQ